jgi:invasion protein IalB
MIRVLISLAVLAVLGAGVYFAFFNNKGGAGPAPGTSMAAGAGGGGAPNHANAAPAADAKNAWMPRCNEGEDKHCEVFKRLIVAETGQRLVEMAVGYPTDLNGRAQAVILAPLGLLTTAGIQLELEGGEPVNMEVRTCLPEGCLSVIALPDNFVETMKRTSKIVVAFTDSGSGQKIRVEMPLAGFSETLAKVRV